MSLARNNDQTSTSGKLGGYNGSLSEQSITKKGRGKNSLPSLISSKKINKGEHLIIQASGGGGYGNPGRRSIELVKKDVLRGYISRSTAFKNYGVVFKNTKNFEIDEKSTKKERSRLSKKKK